MSHPLTLRAETMYTHGMHEVRDVRGFWKLINAGLGYWVLRLNNEVVWQGTFERATSLPPRNLSGVF